MLSWCIPLLILLLALVPVPWSHSPQEAPPGPSCFMAGLSCPGRHWHAEDRDGMEHNPQNTLLEGVAVGVCPCQLLAEDCFTLSLARCPRAGTRLRCRLSRHGISMWRGLRACTAVLQMPPGHCSSWQPPRFERLGRCCAYLLGLLLAWGRRTSLRGEGWMLSGSSRKTGSH